MSPTGNRGLITGEDLVPATFFSSGNAMPRGSSFDLTVGKVFDAEGKQVEGPFRLDPGCMVQVVSAETFKLPATITGHVTYKTGLTKSGIWALTVGIVDPGWVGPVTTTLLNFSSVPYAVAAGEAFLRVSFFEHNAIPEKCLPRNVTNSEYLQDVQKTAMTRFPRTFLNKDEIANIAKDNVFARLRTEGIVWLSVIAAVFTVIQIVFHFVDAPSKAPDPLSQVQADQSKRIENLQTQIVDMEGRLKKFESQSAEQSSLTTKATGGNRVTAAPPPASNPDGVGGQQNKHSP